MLRIKPSESGIALIQVLVISMTLVILAIFIQQSVQRQVSVTSVMKDSFQLAVEIDNAEADLIQALLSNKPYRDRNSSNLIAARWNFYGAPFDLTNSITVKLQDESGLININYMNQRLLQRFLELKGSDYKEALSIVASAQDWKDEDNLKRLNGAESEKYENGSGFPRNGLFQHESEFFLVKGAGNIQKDQIKPYLSLVNTGQFNPLNAPKPVLEAFINDTKILESVVKEREDGDLTMFRFFQLTGIDEDEYISFRTSIYMNVRITGQRGEIALSKSFNLVINPRSQTRPLVISRVVWNKN